MILLTIVVFKTCNCLVSGHHVIVLTIIHEAWFFVIVGFATLKSAIGHGEVFFNCLEANFGCEPDFFLFLAFFGLLVFFRLVFFWSVFLILGLILLVLLIFFLLTLLT